MQRSGKVLLLGACVLVPVLWMMRGPSYDIMNSPPKDGVIVAFGDSLTAGFGSKAGATYPDFLAEILGREVLNRGANGETAGDALRRIERDVISEDPAVVIVMLGGNDLLRRLNVDKTFGSLREIVDRSQSTGAMVVLVGIEGLPLLSEDYGSRFETLAAETGCVYITDILDGIMGDDDLMSDQIHPNAAGYRVMAERIADEIEPHLNPE